MTDRARSHVRWFLVFWLFILSAVAFLDRVNISIAGADIAAEFHLTNVELGYIFSSFLVGYALFQTAGGWLADRLGSRLVLSLGVIWWGVFTALTAVVSTKIAAAVLVLAGIRFLFGAGEAVIFPASNQFVSRWIPSQERGIANGIIFAGVGVGSGVTPFLVAYIILHYGWRWSFWISAIIGLLVGIVWYGASRDTPAAHPSVSPSELAHIQAGLTTKASEPVAPRLSWSAILSSGNVWAITIAYFCFGYVAWIFFAWFFIYLAKVRGLDLKASASYSTILFLTMAACSPLGGIICDLVTKKFGKRIGRAGISVVSMFLTAVFVLYGSRAESGQLASILLAAGAGALYLSQSSFWAVTADIASTSSGTVSGFMNMGNQFGGAITASLTPFIASRFGWNSSFLVAAILAVVGAFAWLFVRADQPLENPAPAS
jgi:MFS transporter, ACS family, glucarate transporter